GGGGRVGKAAGGRLVWIVVDHQDRLHGWTLRRVRPGCIPPGVRRGRDRSARPNLPKKVTPRTSGTLRTVADDSVGAEPGELVLPAPHYPAHDHARVLRIISR